MSTMFEVECIPQYKSIERQTVVWKWICETITAYDFQIQSIKIQSGLSPMGMYGNMPFTIFRIGFKNVEEARVFARSLVGYTESPPIITYSEIIEEEDRSNA